VHAAIARALDAATDGDIARLRIAKDNLRRYAGSLDIVRRERVPGGARVRRRG